MNAMSAFPRRPLLHERVRDTVKRYILESGLQPGDPLPPEGEIARMLGISRASLREAMRSLQAVGIIETIHGEGTFVGGPSFTAMEEGIAFQIGIQHGAEDTHMGRSLYELVIIRELLESAAVARLAPTYSDDDLQQLTTITDAMRDAANSGRNFMDEDILFHDLLYRGAQNAMLQQLVGAFFHICDSFRHPAPPTAMLLRTAQHHADIVDALRHRDAAGASQAMKTHFAGLSGWFDALGQPLVFIGDSAHPAESGEP